MITTEILPFKQLSLDTFYDILALRSAVFLVEQGCVYQDLDYRDQIADHLMMWENTKLIAYARILPYDNQQYMSFGRVITHPDYRRQGLGRQLMEVILTYLQTHYPAHPIRITAQHYLQDFYESYGFKAQGEPFELEGRPHIKMEKQP